MTITKKEVLIHEYSGQNDNVCIHTDIHYYDEDGNYFATMRVHTASFMPFELAKMKVLLKDENHPIAIYVDSLWTPDIVAKNLAAYRAALGESDATNVDNEGNPISPKKTSA